MVVRVDQAGNDDMVAQVDDFVRRLRQVGGRPDLLDDAVAAEQAAVGNFRPGVVHDRQDARIAGQQGRHVTPPGAVSVPARPNLRRTAP